MRVLPEDGGRLVTRVHLNGGDKKWCTAAPENSGSVSSDDMLLGYTSDDGRLHPWRGKLARRRVQRAPTPENDGGNEAAPENGGNNEADTPLTCNSCGVEITARTGYSYVLCKNCHLASRDSNGDDANMFDHGCRYANMPGFGPPYTHW